MIDLDDSKAWAKAFGLADTPLFKEDAEGDTHHRVLLDGGHGTFALSVGPNSEEAIDARASWVWSGDIPHHVLVRADRVQVARWDNLAGAVTFSRSSIERRTEEFYRFLTLDRVAGGVRVVEQAVALFRRLRTVIPAADAEGRSIEAFLLLLAAMIEESAFEISNLEALAHRSHLSAESVTALLSAPRHALESLAQDHRTIQVGTARLNLHPDLAVRHAGGVIFQEAHFELLRPPTPDLFGYVPQPSIRVPSRGGVHFTPPALARTLAEQALAAIDDVHARKSLVLSDPACGSGAFLTETLRALRRLGYSGSVAVHGRDVSTHAVSMARFALARATLDWMPAGGIELDIQVLDSLQPNAIPRSDIIVMNPPFAAWPSLDEGQREQVRQILGHTLHYRADLSMAFILRALESLNQGGALSVLFPASLLTLQSAREWRRALTDGAQIRFLASLGDYGLFEYALVQVAAAVLTKSSHAEQVTTLWTKDDKATTGEALRTLRRQLHHGGAPDAAAKDWRIAQVPSLSVVGADTWRIASVASERLVADLRRAIRTEVRDIFAVQQGIRTGANDVFLLSHEKWNRLPKAEKAWFRPAVVNDSIVAGILRAQTFVFYPYRDDRLAFETEQELQSVVPTYARTVLFPNRERLMSRVRMDDGRWWRLSEKRSWLSQPTRRIVSKYFGEQGSFALDNVGNFAVVQGFGWTPLERLGPATDETNYPFARPDFYLEGYAALLNSRIFEILLATAAPQVSGGQYDLSPRYVNAIPLPNLVNDVLDSGLGRVVRMLNDLGRDVQLADRAWRERVDEAVAVLYRTRMDTWIDL